MDRPMFEVVGAYDGSGRDPMVVADEFFARLGEPKKKVALTTAHRAGRAGATAHQVPPVIPACPNCGKTEWWWVEEGGSIAEGVVEHDDTAPAGGVIFRQIDHSESITMSYFWCSACGLNRDDIDLSGKYDTVQDALYELRDSAKRT